MIFQHQNLIRDSSQPPPRGIYPRVQLGDCPASPPPLLPVRPVILRATSVGYLTGVFKTQRHDLRQAVLSLLYLPEIRQTAHQLLQATLRVNLSTIIGLVFHYAKQTYFVVPNLTVCIFTEFHC